MDGQAVEKWMVQKDRPVFRPSTLLKTYWKVNTGQCASPSASIKYISGFLIHLAVQKSCKIRVGGYSLQPSSGIL